MRQDFLEQRNSARFRVERHDNDMQVSFETAAAFERLRLLNLDEISFVIISHAFPEFRTLGLQKVRSTMLQSYLLVNLMLALNLHYYNNKRHLNSDMI